MSLPSFARLSLCPKTVKFDLLLNEHESELSAGYTDFRGVKRARSQSPSREEVPEYTLKIKVDGTKYEKEFALGRWSMQRIHDIGLYQYLFNDTRVRINSNDARVTTLTIYTAIGAEEVFNIKGVADAAIDIMAQLVLYGKRPLYRKPTIETTWDVLVAMLCVYTTLDAAERATSMASTKVKEDLTTLVRSKMALDLIYGKCPEGVSLSCLRTLVAVLFAVVKDTHTHNYFQDDVYLAEKQWPHLTLPQPFDVVQVRIFSKENFSPMGKEHTPLVYYKPNTHNSMESNGLFLNKNIASAQFKIPPLDQLTTTRLCRQIFGIGVVEDWIQKAKKLVQVAFDILSTNPMSENLIKEIVPTRGSDIVQWYKPEQADIFSWFVLKELMFEEYTRLPEEHEALPFVSKVLYVGVDLDYILNKTGKTEVQVKKEIILKNKHLFEALVACAASVLLNPMVYGVKRVGEGVKEGEGKEGEGEGVKKGSSEQINWLVWKLKHILTQDFHPLHETQEGALAQAFQVSMDDFIKNITRWDLFGDIYAFIEVGPAAEAPGGEDDGQGRA
jgi:hypothetical protein